MFQVECSYWLTTMKRSRLSIYQAIFYLHCGRPIIGFRLFKPTLIHMKTLVMGETCESAQFRVNERRLSASKWPDRLKRERERRHRCNRCSILKGRNLISFFWLVFLIPSLLRTSRNLLLITYWSWSHYNKPFVELQLSAGLTSQLSAMESMRRRMNQS